MKHCKQTGFARFAPVRLISAIALATLCSVSAQAAVLTSSGTLADQPAGAYELFNFKVTQAGSTSFRLDGNTDAYLGLFSGTNVLDNANYITQNDDSGGGLNSAFTLNLGVGSYTAWITSHGSFWDTNANAISFNHDHTPMAYTLTINGGVVPGGDPTDVPEPATLALLGLGLAGFAASRRKS